MGKTRSFKQSLIVMSLALASWPAMAGAPQDLPLPAAATAPPEVLTDRLIVGFGSVLDRLSLGQRLAAWNLRAGVSDQPVLTAVRRMHDGAWVIRLDRPMSPRDIEALQPTLAGVLGGATRVEPDLRLFTLAVPNDPLYNQQWGLNDATAGIRVAGAHDLALGRGVVVAVIDNGVRPHADLAANLLSGFDFISDARTANDGGGRDADASDPGDGYPAGYCPSDPVARSSVWHGTHVAGIVAAVTGNGQGMAGVAPQARVLPVRVLGRCGGYLSDVADGMVWASGGFVPGAPSNPTPAKVLNLSLGGSGSCPASMQSAVNAVNNAGGLVVVAAGNSNTNASSSVPANCSGVLTVAATALSGGRASYSNFGSTVALAAPGGDTDAGILSTYNRGTQAPSGDSFSALRGTSMAAPHVAGVAALMWSANPSASSAQIRQALVATARPFPAACSGCGAGIVDADAAVRQVSGGGAAPAPSPSPSPSPNPAPAPAPAPAPVVDRNEVEPNNTVASAQGLPAGSVRISGAIESGDIDHFSLTLPAGASVSATLTPAAGLNFDLTALDGAGRVLAASSQGTGMADMVSVRNNTGASSVVVLRVTRGGWLLLASPNGRYTLEVNR